MQISNVKITPPTNPQSKALANVSVVFDDCFVVGGMKILNGSKGQFLSMPSFKDQTTNKYVDTSYPITAEFRKILNDTVMNQFNSSSTPQGAPQPGVQDYGIQWGPVQNGQNGQFVMGTATQAFHAAWAQNQQAMETAGYSKRATPNGTIVYKMMAQQPPPQQQYQTQNPGLQPGYQQQPPQQQY